MGDKVSIVKEKVLIPEYFSSIIEPEMGSYYSDYTVNFDLKPVVKCPLHGEDTPSFRYYEDTNTFYCFGCGAGGDIIELHKRFTESISGKEIYFKDAVEYLYNRFIDKREAIKIQEDKVERFEASKVELILLEKYLLELEDLIKVESSLSEDNKVQLYNSIDDAKELCALGFARPNDCMQYIKKLVSEIVI